MRVDVVHPFNLPQTWHLVKPYIDKPFQYNNGEILSTDLLKGLMEDYYILLVAHNDEGLQGAIVAEFIIHPQKKELFILSWGMKDWKGYNEWSDLFEQRLIGLALDNGCHYMSAWCRKGLAQKMVTLHGWDHSHSIVSKQVQPTGEN
mgnify:FL=1